MFQLQNKTMGNTCCKLPRRSRTARAQRPERYVVTNDPAIAAVHVNENQLTTEASATMPNQGTATRKSDTAIKQ